MTEEITERYCQHCGARVDSAARFCPRCGQPLDSASDEPVLSAPEPAPARIAAAPRRNVAPFLIAPVLIIVAALVFFKLLSGFPHERKSRTVETRPAAATAPIRETTSTVEPDLVQEERPAPVATHPAPVATTPARPAPVVTPSHSVAPADAPVQVTEEAPRHELSEEESVDRLLSYVGHSRYYGNDGSCIRARSRGYRNRGYTIDLLAAGCEGAEDGVLDRWRVDALTGDVYKQASDGRYLRP